MRIALLTHQWPGVRLGGIGVYTVNCARGLAAAGHEVHVFTLTLPADARRGIPAGVIVHEIEPPAEAHVKHSVIGGGELMYRMALAQALAAEALVEHERMRFDVIEAPEYEGISSGLGEGTEVLVIQLHSGSALARDASGGLPTAEQAMMEALELAEISIADGICAPSRAVVADTWRAYGVAAENVPEAEIVPLPFYGETGARFVPAPRDGAVLFVGRLEWLKGAHLLATAAREFLEAFPEARMRVVGPDTMTAPKNESGASGFGGKSMAGWMREEIARGGGGLLERVTFCGERNAREIAGEMQDCAFVVVPSLRESYSYVCCEALAAGRAVVVSDQIGATEVVGNAGLRFVRGDAADLARVMGSLWGDGAMRERLSRVAWERSQDVLSPGVAIAQRLAFYEAVIARQKAGKKPWENAMSKVQSSRGLLAQELFSGEFSLLPQLSKMAEVELEIMTPGMRVLKQLTPHPKSRFHLYGAGRHTSRLLTEKSKWETEGHHLVGLIDDHARYADGGILSGLPVVSVKAAEKTLGTGDVVVLSTDAFEEQFWRQTEGLRGKGVAVLRLYG